MHITGIGSDFYAQKHNALKGKEGLSFQEVLASIRQGNTVTEFSKSEAVCKQWRETPSPGIGIVREIDVGAVLTAGDKLLFGWPCEGEAMDETLLALLGSVIMDRLEGTLVGPITQEYLFGNPAKGVDGLVHRFRLGVLSKERLALLLLRLS